MTALSGPLTLLELYPIVHHWHSAPHKATIPIVIPPKPNFKAISTIIVPNQRQIPTLRVDSTRIVTADSQPVPVDHPPYLSLDSHSKTKLYYSLYYLQVPAISSAVVPRLGDKVGRKVPYLASMFAQFLMYILLFISRNIYLTIFCYFIIGLASGGRVAIGTMYLNEFIPAKYQ